MLNSLDEIFIMIYFPTRELGHMNAEQLTQMMVEGTTKISKKKSFYERTYHLCMTLELKRKNIFHCQFIHNYNSKININMCPFMHGNNIDMRKKEERT